MRELGRCIVEPTFHRHNRDSCEMLLVAAVVFADMAMSFPSLSMAFVPWSWMCKGCGTELALTSFR